MGIIRTRHCTQTVAAYSALHFLVDFACAFLMMRAVAPITHVYDRGLAVLLYNFCAFALQMPFGVAADRIARPRSVALCGCALTGLAFALWRIPFAAVVLSGLGNALFHVGGGMAVLNESHGTNTAPGLFVSPGALGIYFGTVSGMDGRLPAAALPALAAACVVSFAILLSARDVRREMVLDSAASSVSISRIQIAVVCLFAVVCCRSFVGLAVVFPWKTGGWTVAAVCAVALGKALGGVAADKLGAAGTASASLAVAALLFLFPHRPLAGILSLLLFNMSMPVTLVAMANIFTRAKGFAFGLLSFALFLGFLPVHLGVAIRPDAVWVAACVSAASAALLYGGMSRARL